MHKVVGCLGLIFLALGLLRQAEPPPSQACASLAVRKFVASQYPELARLAWIEGSVPAKVDINSSGIVVRVETLGGHPVLASRVAEALKQWEFCPLQGAQTIQVTFEFKLMGEGRDKSPSTTVEAVLPYRVEIRTNPQEVKDVYGKLTETKSGAPR